MAALLDIHDAIKDNAPIGTRLIKDIIVGTKFREVAAGTCDKNTYMEEVVEYNNDFYSVDEDGKTHMYLIRSQKKGHVMTCFEPQNDRVAVRTLQQKLADVTTGFIIQNLTDKNYNKVFKAFYKPLTRLLQAYCRSKKFSMPYDICVYYKGGNMFKMLLTDITELLDAHKDIMKRSDADFQIYIRPSLDNIVTVREEVSLLVMHVLYSIKAYMKRRSLITIPDASLPELQQLYMAELRKLGWADKVRSVVVKTKKLAARDDFAIKKGTLGNHEYIMLQKFHSLVHGAGGAEAVSKSTYFISRNTSLDFQRKDQKRSHFDLMRMRRNFRLEVAMTDDTVINVNVPFEIYDVSIPKEGDVGLAKLHENGIYNYVRQYHCDGVPFYAPTVSYLLDDLHDVLFAQNEYPWQDVKYEKRLMRYFLTVIVYEIVEALRGGGAGIETLGHIQKAFEVAGGGGEYVGYLANLGAEMSDLAKNNSIRKEYAVFNEKINAIMRNMARELGRVQMCFTSATASKIQRVYNELFVQGQTKMLGGAMRRPRRRGASR